jgi:hypothetical protein
MPSSASPHQRTGTALALPHRPKVHRMCPESRAPRSAPPASGFIVEIPAVGHVGSPTAASTSPHHGEPSREGERERTRVSNKGRQGCMMHQCPRRMCSRPPTRSPHAVCDAPAPSGRGAGESDRIDTSKMHLRHSCIVDCHLLNLAHGALNLVAIAAPTTFMHRRLPSARPRAWSDQSRRNSPQSEGSRRAPRSGLRAPRCREGSSRS